MLKCHNKVTIAWLALACLAIPTASLWAQTGMLTVPVGYLTVNIPAGAGTSGALCFISFPLQGTASASGQMTGQVTGITSNTISNSNGDWTAGQLSQAATPYLIQFTSGAAAGRTFLISTGTTNTATTLTIDAVDASTTDLTTLGIVANTDTYQIIPADTISSVFGTPAQTGVLGGTSANGVDQIQLYSRSSGWASYYYNTTSGWLKVGFPIPSSNTVIRPDTGILYLRYGTTPINLTVTGRVPSVARQTAVANNGNTVLSNNWPTDLTLATANISSLAGWVAASSSATADLVQIYSSTSGWAQYYFNGTNWVKVGFPIISNNVPIPAGTAVIIVKRGSATGQATLTQPIPYSI